MAREVSILVSKGWRRQSGVVEHTIIAEYWTWTSKPCLGFIVSILLLWTIKLTALQKKKKKNHCSRLLQQSLYGHFNLLFFCKLLTWASYTDLASTRSTLKQRQNGTNKENLQIRKTNLLLVCGNWTSTQDTTWISIYINSGFLCKWLF